MSDWHQYRKVGDIHECRAHPDSLSANVKITDNVTLHFHNVRVLISRRFVSLYPSKLVDLYHTALTAPQNPLSTAFEVHYTPDKSTSSRESKRYIKREDKSQTNEIMKERIHFNNASLTNTEIYLHKQTRELIQPFHSLSYF
jgi:hypothetical protein